jgi:hypothetical protein
MLPTMEEEKAFSKRSMLRGYNWKERTGALGTWPSRLEESQK